MAGTAPNSLDEGAALLARHREGDPRAFGVLMERYGKQVYGYLLRSGLGPTVADDLFQETFLRVHRSSARYDSRYPFKTWLFTIAHNLVRSHFRKQRVRRVMTGWFRRPAGADPHAPAEALDPADDAPDQEARVGARQQIRLVAKTLEDLPAGPRQALLLTRVEGMSMAEAAQVLGVGVPTVKTWIRRGRLKLAEVLQQRDEGDPS